MVISEIKLDHISLDISDVAILKNLQLTFQPGIHCLLGPNGSGKTMTNRVVTLLEEPTAGTLYWDNTVIRPNSEVERIELIRKIGYMRQEPVFVNKTVQENIVLPLKFRKLNSDFISDMANQSLDQFGLQELAEKNINTLSTGQKQKVALARTLISDPEIIVLDEPSSSLDMASTKWFEETIITLQKENPKIVIWTTHDQFQAKRIASSISILIDGEIIISSSPREVFESEIPIAKTYLSGELFDPEDFSS